MEQDLLGKQLLLDQMKARYEKLCAVRARSIQHKNDKEDLECQIDTLFKEVNSLKLRLRTSTTDKTSKGRPLV